MDERLAALLEQGQMVLRLSNKVAPGKRTGLLGFASAFASLRPEVQQAAETEAAKLDDGAHLEVSPLDGRKKALLIGLNYKGQSNELKGCINDVKNMVTLLRDTFGFEDITILTDDTERKPTRANMISELHRLVEGAAAGDSLFVHYSGHGAYSKDTRPDSDEADGQDETLVPLDYKESGMITDDELFDILVAPLPKYVRLSVVTDACHSGSVLDLPYSYVLNVGSERAVEIDHRKMALASAMAAGKALLAKDFGGAWKQLMQAGEHYIQQGGGQTIEGPGAASSSSDGGATNVSSSHISAEYITVRTALADVVQFSGCRDDQTSADAFLGGESCGAMSFALIKAFEDHGTNQTYAELLKNVRTTLHGRYKQIPQLSVGHRMLDLEKTVFSLGSTGSALSKTQSKSKPVPSDTSKAHASKPQENVSGHDEAPAEDHKDDSPKDDRKSKKTQKDKKSKKKDDDKSQEEEESAGEEKSEKSEKSEESAQSGDERKSRGSGRNRQRRDSQSGKSGKSGKSGSESGSGSD